LTFTHLHLHTEYSLLDGANRIAQLPARVKELGMTSCAITDHGVMYGVVDFYNACNEAGVKPIIGCEVYVAPNGRFQKDSPTDKQLGHLILLAENNVGLENLNLLVSLAFLEGFYYRPRVDHELLRGHSEGLIALSSCMSGEVPRAILAGDPQRARELATEYNDIFGKNNFYLEMQSNGIQQQAVVNRALRDISAELDIPLVATNDCHYMRKEDARAHEILLCMQTGKVITDPDRMRMGTDQLYVKSPEEMEAAFSDCPEAIENTALIAERCDVTFDFDTIHLPAFDVPDGGHAGDYLRELCFAGLARRLELPHEHSREEYETRLDMELRVIDSMGYTDYYLIVWDFIRFARERGIIVGPGRGSGAGSLAAYCIGITNIDPLCYSLLFERFLNPERVSMPDFDIDFCYERRGEVIDYVTRKYGKQRVSQVITFGTLAARASVRDVCRALDVPYAESDRLAKMIPNELKMTLDKALETSPELKSAYENDSVTKDVIDTARLFEGMPRHASTHAAGVIISSEPIVKIAPLAKNDDSVVVQYAKETIESLGLLKFDFLGLRTLTVLQDTAQMVRDNYGVEIDYDRMSMDDPTVFQMISEGDTAGVFQLESSGMTSFMKELKPESLEDIIAGVALFRPGPMKQIPRYVAGRHADSKISCHHPLLEPILDVTYGCMVYQEQVMQIVRTVAGFSLGQADNVRRAMSSKKPELLSKYEELFIQGGVDENGKVIDGALARGVSLPIAKTIWEEVMEFANYAFNKSHAAAYAVVAYQTAWLKRHYPVEFMAAMLNSYMGNLGQAATYIEVCRKKRINVLPPDVNRSQIKFVTEDGAIRFGLGAVKNVGPVPLRELIAERETNGPFLTYGDFLRRMSAHSLNKKLIESLIRSSAFDSFGISRSKLIAALEPFLAHLNRQKNSIMEGQLSLFELTDTVDPAPTEPDYPSVPDFPTAELLDMEREMTGVYISGHPLDDYSLAIGRQVTLTSDLFHGDQSFEAGEDTLDAGDSGVKAGVRDGRRGVMAGLIVKRTNKSTRNNDLMCFLTLEDVYGRYEAIVFPKVMQEYNTLLQERQAVLLSGRVSASDDQETKIIADRFAPLPKNAEISDGGQSTDSAANFDFPVAPSGRDAEQRRGGTYPPNKETFVSTDVGLILAFDGERDSSEYRRLLATLAFFNGDTRTAIYFPHENRLDSLYPDCWLEINDFTLKLLMERYGAANLFFIDASTLPIPDKSI
jgi:DNA polymerase-3 subunit alpha